MTQRAIIATHAWHNCAYFWLQPRRDVQDARGTTMSRRRPFFVLRRWWAISIKLNTIAEN